MTGRARAGLRVVSASLVGRCFRNTCLASSLLLTRVVFGAALGLYLVVELGCADYVFDVVNSIK